MRIVETSRPEVWEAISSGHAGLFLFGLPFFLAGFFVMSLSLGLIPVEGDSGPWYFLVPFGSVFSMVGLVLMVGRRGIVIDRQRHRVVKWYGLLVPMIRRESLLTLCDRLALTREVRRSDKSTRIVYPVRLEGSAQEQAIHIVEPLDYQEARRTAESLSEFLRLPLVDLSSGTEVVREPERLDESIRERARRTREEIPEAVAPPQIRSALEEESGTLRIQIPPTDVTAVHRLHLVAAVIFIGITAFILTPMLASDARDPMSYLFIGLLGAGFVVLPLVSTLSRVAGQARRGCTVQASPSVLRIEQGKRVTEIFADELEELEVCDSPLPAGIKVGPDGRLMIDKSALSRERRNQPFTSAGSGQMTPVGPVLSFLLSAMMKMAPGPSIMARSDRKTVRFGAGLAKEELSYLYARLKRILAA